ncbi:MAG: dynamin family protein [Treponemataceae bacterium]
MTAIKNFMIIDWVDFIKTQDFFYKKKNLTEYINNILFFIRNLKRNEYEKTDTGSYLYSQLAIPSTTDIMLSVKKIRKHIFGNKVDYRYLIIAFILFESEHLGIIIDDKMMLQIQNKLLFSKKEILTEKFLSVMNNIKSFSGIADKYITRSFSPLLAFILKHNTYNRLPIKNIAVCATMSAGKSTFVNALLGNDCLPSRNEATTTKITSVYDKDLATKLIGFSASGVNKCEFSSNVSKDIVDSWNISENVTQIHLQGDLDNIGNHASIITVHDTPGTNNSATKDHSDITFSFLRKNTMDAIIYVANAEHLETNDEKVLLSDLYKNIVEKTKIPVVFVLNKADNIDDEKEDINKIISNYKQFLETLGYKNPIVYPVSAKAARLFKIANKNKDSTLSLSEIARFPVLFDQFFNHSNFSGEKSLSSVQNNEIVIIGKKEYSHNDLVTALHRTGIKTIEQTIEKIINK